MAWPNDVTRKDLRIEYFRGSGPGGQHRNKTSSACRITHVPTGISAKAEDERCQHKNKRIAFRRLAEKLVPIMKKLARGDTAAVRPTERIRTYHAVRGTVKDERVPGTAFDYEKTINGDLDPLISAIAVAQEK